MLFNTLDHVLGTQTKVQILRALSELASPVSGNKARRLAGVRSVSGAGQALDDLTALGLLLREEAGGAHLYRVNRDHALADALASLFASERRLFAVLRAMLVELLEEEDLTSAVRSIILFGSTARGEAAPDSDLDLLVVVTDEARVEPVRVALLEVEPSVRKRLGLRLSAYVLTEARVEARFREGDPLMETIETEGRTLLGEPIQAMLGIR